MNYLDEIILEMTQRSILENQSYTNDGLKSFESPVMKNTLRDRLEESFIKLLTEFSKLGYTKNEIHQIVEMHTPNPVSFKSHTSR